MTIHGIMKTNPALSPVCGIPKYNLTRGVFQGLFARESRVGKGRHGVGCGMASFDLDVLSDMFEVARAVKEILEVRMVRRLFFDDDDDDNSYSDMSPI